METALGAPVFTYWLLPRLTEFRLLHPEVELRISTVDTDRFAGLGDWTGLDQAVLHEERIYPVAAPDHPLARPETRPADLVEADLLVHGHHDRFGWDTWFARHGPLDPGPLFTSTSDGGRRTLPDVDADEPPLYVETQHFPWWIRTTVLLLVVVLAVPVIALWAAGTDLLGPALVVTAVALVLALLAGQSVVATLVTTIDGAGLHLRIRPRGTPLPRRLTRKDVALGDIVGFERHAYNALTDTDYWGWHLWGLGVGRHGHYLYIMRPDSPFTGRGVQVDLRTGERMLIGSSRPDDLADALRRAMRDPGPGAVAG